MPVAEDFLDRRVRDLLEDIAAQTPTPGGGSVAAIAVAMAAGLVSMAARFSREHWEDAPGAAAQAEALRARVAPLARADAIAYEKALAALRLAKDGASEARDQALGEALERAASVPLEIAAAGADVAMLAADVAEAGNPNLCGDAAAGAALAEAGTRAAAKLVAVNLGTMREDERVVAAKAFVEAARRAAKRALDVTR
jgi:formiminotetrahydrofolate cyclodeaminase